MSGIYIPDVGLPQYGDFELWISIKKDGSYNYNISGGWNEGKRKVVPVQPHGKLIDADAFSAKIIELLTNLQNCYDCYCEGCKYKHLLEPGNFVKCMNALIKESADAIETLQVYVDLYKDLTDTSQKTARALITAPVKHGTRQPKKEN